MDWTKEKILEWSGVATVILYSLLVAMNIGARTPVDLLASVES